MNYPHFIPKLLKNFMGMLSVIDSWHLEEESQISNWYFLYFAFDIYNQLINYRQNIIKCVEGRRTSLAGLHREVYGSKKSGARKFSWTKWSWKASEQEDCAVCLESFKVGETLINLPCAHRFHERCLKPWLENNSHCPCCRTTILSL